MSVDAIRWAFKQNIKPSSTKFVLVAMADRAGENHECFPSIDRLCDDTGQDRKTVQESLQRLADMGLIRDTGDRKGSTGRVRVFQLIGVEGREGNRTENGTVTKLSRKRVDSPLSIVPKTGPLSEGNDPENGMLNDPENGMLNDPENGTLNHKENHQGTTRRKSTKKMAHPTEQEVVDYFLTNGYTAEAGRKAYQYYSTPDDNGRAWHDSRGTEIKNWKQKMISVWFKQENKIQNKTSKGSAAYRLLQQQGANE